MLDLSNPAGFGVMNTQANTPRSIETGLRVRFWSSFGRTRPLALQEQRHRIRKPNVMEHSLNLCGFWGSAFLNVFVGRSCQ